MKKQTEFKKTPGGGWIWEAGFDSLQGAKASGRFIAIFDYLLEAVSLVNEQVKFTYVNPAFVKLYGYGGKEILGKRPDIISPRSIRSAQKDEINQKADGEPRIVTNVTRDGRPLEITLKVFPLKDGGVKIGVLGLSLENDRLDQMSNLLIGAARAVTRNLEAQLDSKLRQCYSLQTGGRILPQSGPNLISEFEKLSPRRREVLKLWAQYEDRQRVARDLRIASSTVGVHLNGALNALGLGGKTNGEKWHIVKHTLSAVEPNDDLAPPPSRPRSGLKKKQKPQ